MLKRLFVILESSGFKLNGANRLPSDAKISRQQFQEKSGGYGTRDLKAGVPSPHGCAHNKPSMRFPTMSSTTSKV